MLGDSKLKAKGYPLGNSPPKNFRGYIGSIWGLYRDNGEEDGKFLK